MVSSAVHNLSDFLKNRPPLVVFLICLVALAVSTFYFAFEIEKDGPVVNSDKQHDWIKMLKHFNSLVTCVNLSTWTTEINNREKTEDFTNGIAVFTTFSVENITVLKPYAKVYGFLSLEGWYSTACQNPEKQAKVVEISFDVPPQAAKENTSVDICVTIKGPAEYLPFLKEPLCKPAGKAQNSKAKIGFLSSKFPGTYDAEFCAKGDIAKFEFDLTMPQVENYLNDDVRTQIYIHLMWCSYFLVFVIFCILIYSIFKKSEYLEKKEQSARLL